MSDDFIFEEVSANAQKISLSLGILTTKTIYKSDRIGVYDSEAFGRCLYLDGALQLCEKYHIIYHETMVHSPISQMYSVENVLVIGGGDGGCIVELLKYKNILSIDWCEINPEVIEVTRNHLPFMNMGKVNDPRVKLEIGDGVEFVKNAKKKYDLILIDCSDPTREAIPLYDFSFLKRVRSILSGNGVVSLQAGNVFTSEKFVRKITAMFAILFKNFSYQYIPMPCFPGGGVGFCLGFNGHRCHARLWGVEVDYLDMDNLEASFLTPYTWLKSKRKALYKLSGKQDTLNLAEKLFVQECIAFEGEPQEAGLDMGLFGVIQNYEKKKTSDALRVGTVLGAKEILNTGRLAAIERGINLPKGFLVNFITWEGDTVTYSMVKSVSALAKETPAEIEVERYFPQGCSNLTYEKNKLVRKSISLYDLSKNTTTDGKKTITHVKVGPNHDDWRDKLKHVELDVDLTEAYAVTVEFRSPLSFSVGFFSE